MTGAGLTHTSAFPGPWRSAGDMVHVVLIIGTPSFLGLGLGRTARSAGVAALVRGTLWPTRRRVQSNYRGLPPDVSCRTGRPARRRPRCRPGPGPDVPLVAAQPLTAASTSSP